MAITIDGKVFRNIQEQVEKNKEDIEELVTSSQVLQEFGIKVVGHVVDATDLPDESTYDGSYGDAYTVGTTSPYDYYIWTRPTTSILYAHWFNVGVFPAPGPQGPTGPTGPEGPQGVRGSLWFKGQVNPTTITGYNVGDLYLNTSNGYLYILKSGTPNYWEQMTDITGPQGPTGAQGPTGPQGIQGPTGPQGPEGPVGKNFDIEGVVATESSLPTASLVGPSKAYLVGAAAPYDLYIIIGTGTELDPYQWFNTGKWNDFTLIELSSSSGTLTDEQYNSLVATPHAMVKFSNRYYRFNYDSGTYLYYISLGYNSNIYSEFRMMPINKTNKTYYFVTSSILLSDAAVANPTLSGTEADLTSIGIKGTVYKIPSNSLVLEAVYLGDNDSGTISQANLQKLVDNPFNTIYNDNEYYRFADNMTSSDYLVYTHVGHDNSNNPYVKFITITISTRDWVKTTNQLVKQEEVSSEINGFKDAIGGTLRQCLCVKETLDFNNTAFIDMSSLSFVTASATGNTYAQVSGAKIGSKSMCTKYKTYGNGTITMADMCCAFNESQTYVYIQDLTLANKPNSEIKEYLKGVLLAYEKAS